MEVHLTPEKEARLHQFATRTGRNAAQVVEEAVDRLLEDDAQLRELVFTPLPYVAVYRLTPTHIEISRIWHGVQRRQ